MPKDNGHKFDLPEGTDDLNAHLAEMDDDRLSALIDELGIQFDEAYGDGTGLSDDDLSRLKKIGEQIQAAETLAESRTAERVARDEHAKALRASVRKPAAEAPDDAAAVDARDSEAEAVDAEKPVEDKDLVSAGMEKTITASVSAAVGETMKAFAADWLKKPTDLNSRVRLGTVAQYAPDAKVHEQRSEAVITASADVPGFTQGGRIESIEMLGMAMHKRARMLPTTNTGRPNVYPVAALQREFTFMLDENATPTQMNEVLTAASDVDILTAAGGWCAPSEISYDFFNIVCEDGMIDLPTIGLSRGGVQYPTSPSFGDLAGIPDIVWTWTEQDDIDAVDSASIFKPCVRLECPEFINRRADCDGFCVTAGNLIDYAYPELVSNWLRLVMAIRARATNARIIDLMLNGGGSGDDIGPSIPVDHTGLMGATTSALLTSIELSITDYRERYSMCGDAILEVVLPRWATAVIRADLANRDGLDVFAVTNAMIADWFNIRSARVQFVGDWQVRDVEEPGSATPIVDWPTTLQYMVYAPGTFVRANGMSLDLGVTRDSVLNAQNDHTAAWVEECYALLKPGHESRVVTVDICGSGEIGARTFTCATDEG